MRRLLGREKTEPNISLRAFTRPVSVTIDDLDDELEDDRGLYIAIAPPALLADASSVLICSLR